MTATILPEIVQLPFGLGNLVSGSVVSYPRPVGPAPTEDIEMFARKGVFSSIGRAGAVATVAAMALTAVEPSMAFAGSATRQGRDGCRPAPATRPISAPAAGIIAVAAVPPRQRPSPASSAPALRSPPPRTAATIMTAMATTAAAPAITAAARLITAARLLRRRLLSLGRAATIAGTPTPAGKLRPLLIATVQDESTGRPGRWIF